MKGFSWRHGPERETTGILMWSEVFLHESKNEKYAIILMDTQGVFDSQSTAKDCAFIFALSTLISSVQIYNISQQIQENDLQHLQLFTEYGRMVLNKFQNKPFGRLQFLVRDWQWPGTYPYGVDGGNKLLSTFLGTASNQAEDLKSVREHIKSCFSEVECFLMPHPGFEVTSNPYFKGELESINGDFKEYIKVLVPLLSAPENLKVKQINGNEIRAQDLITYFKCYMKDLNGDNIPEPKTIMDATAEANHISAISQAKDFYLMAMKKVCDNKEYFSEKELNKEHSNIQKKCIEMVSLLKIMKYFFKFIFFNISVVTRNNN